MKILFVSANSNPLVPPVNGDAQRTRLLYEACKRFAEVDVVSLAGQPLRTPQHGRMRKWLALLPFSKITALFPVDPHWEAVVDAAVKKTDYDFIVARYFYRALSCGLWKYRDKLIVDFDDELPFFFLNQLTPDAALTRRIRLKLAARKAKHITRRAVQKMRGAFFAEECVAKANGGRFLPNIPYYVEGCADADLHTQIKRLVFVGHLDYQPNQEGLSHFLDRVYLPLRGRITDVELHVVGQIKDEVMRQRWQGYPGVTVMGFVDDLRQEYAECQVAVVPVYHSGATNIKLLEAMAMNRACVTTKEAFAKLGDRFVADSDLGVAANDNGFVERLVTLLTDEQANHDMAHRAKAVMGKYYSFDAFCEMVKTAIG